MESGTLKGLGTAPFLPGRTVPPVPSATIFSKYVGNIGVGGQTTFVAPYTQQGTNAVTDFTTNNAIVVYDQTAPSNLRAGGGVIDAKLGMVTRVSALAVNGLQGNVGNNGYPILTSYPLAAAGVAAGDTGVALLAYIGCPPITWNANSELAGILVNPNIRNNAQYAFQTQAASIVKLGGFIDMIQSGGQFYGLWVNTNFGSSNTSTTTFTNHATLYVSGQWTPSSGGVSNLTNRWGIRVNQVDGAAYSTSGVITNYYGMEVSVNTPAGYTAVTTFIGLYMNTLSGNFGALWALGIGNFNSYFAGKTAFGNSNTPANTIDIQSGVINGVLDTMTYAATIALSVTAGQIHKTTTVNATGNATINASSGGTAGQWMWIIVTNDGTSGKTITFGTNFKSTGVISGTTSKTATVGFISDGTSWWEHGRTLLL